MFLNDDGAAENVSGSRGQAQQQTENDGVHSEVGMIAALVLYREKVSERQESQGIYFGGLGFALSVWSK